MSDVVDARGRRMIELLNLSDVVVLNGVQKARAQQLNYFFSVAVFGAHTLVFRFSKFQLPDLKIFS